MPSSCCVSTCREFWTGSRTVSFFRFPLTNEALKEKWLKAGPGYKTVSKYSSVCSKHFRPEDYADWTPYGSRRQLKKDAVPSIFDPVCSADVNDEIPDSDDGNYSGCDSSDEANAANKLDAGQRTSAKRLRKSLNDGRPQKTFSSVAVQTCPRLSGPSDREKELQGEIHLLQGRLRWRDKKIRKAIDRVARLKNEVKNESEATLEDTADENADEASQTLPRNNVNGGQSKMLLVRVITKQITPAKSPTVDRMMKTTESTSPKTSLRSSEISSVSIPSRRDSSREQPKTVLVRLVGNQITLTKPPIAGKIVKMPEKPAKTSMVIQLENV